MTTQTSRLVIEIDSRNAERNARAIANELQSIQRNGDSASRSVDSMSVATRSLAGYMAGLVTVGAAIAKMDTYTGLQNRLKLVTDSQKELNQAMDDTFKIAQNTGSAWDSVAMVYQRFADNADRLGISMSKTAELTETVSKAIAISGGNAASAEAALTQFGQALASGVLRGEEFNSIAEQAPGLLKAIAFGMDVNIGKLRAMAADGKITGDALVDALTKAQPHIDDLFSKTDFTIGNSLTQLSNAVTQFIGEAGRGSGAASLLSESISGLAKNLGTVADIAVVGGVALLTKTILAQTVAIYGSITASIQRRATDIAALQSQVQLSAIEVQRTRQVAALALTEINLARQELNSATTRQARAAATMRLTQAEIAHRVALNQTRVATIAQTTAESTLNAARSRGAALLGLVGGPIGALTIGVAALAAGYMYMQHRTQQANERLAEQMQWAGKTKDELLALRGVQKEVATNELSDAFDKQNLKLKQLNNEYLGFIDNVVRSSQGNKDAAAIFEQARKGTLSQADALEQLNKLDVMTAQQKKQGLDMVNNTILQAEETLKAKKALSIFGIEAKLGGNSASNMAAEQNSLANASDNAARGVRNAADAVADYNQKLKSQRWDLEFTNNLIQQHGFSAQEADLRLQAYRENAKKGIKGTTAEQRELIKGIIAQQDSADAYKKAQQDAERARNSSAKKSISDAAKEEKRRAKEAEKNAEESLRLREQYTYEYAAREKQIETNLQKELADIRKAGLPSAIEDRAKSRANIEKKLYQAEIDLQVNEFKMGELEKIKAKHTIDQYRLALDQQYSAKNLSTLQKSLQEQAQIEIASAKLANEERIFQMQQGLMHANARSEKYWDLERERISRSVHDLAERNKQLAIANALQSEEKRTNLNDAVQQWGSINAELTGTTEQYNLEKERFDRLNASQVLFDAELAMAGENYALKEQAYQAHVDRMSAIEGEYQVSSMQLQLSYGESITGSMATIMKAIGGEQSRGYQVMYAISKGFAVSQAALSLITNISKASEIGFPQNIPMILGAMGQGVQIASMLSGIQAPTGYATGGLFTGDGHVRGPGTGTSDSINARLSNYEFVTRASAVKKIGVENMEYMNRTGELPIQRADGGLVTPKDTYRVGMGTIDAINRGADIQAERQAQASAKAQSANPQKIMNNLRVIMVKDEDEAKDMLYGPDGEKAFLYHQRRNRSKA